MTGPGHIAQNARRRGAFWPTGAMVILLGAGGGACLAKASVQEERVDYRFTPPALQVPLSLPAGTVMATTIIPDDVLGHRDDSGAERLWFSDRREASGPVITAPTNLAGVGIRMVLESAVRSAATPASTGGWNVWPALPQMSRGGIHVELVKTGPMRPGAVSAVRSDVQYRVPGRTGASPRPARLVHLHYTGYLSIDILDARHRDAGHRPS